jgi:hypothetical protein
VCVGQRVGQGPGLRKVNGKAPQRVQAAVSEHVAFENVRLAQLRLRPQPGSSAIQQLPDYSEVCAQIIGVLIVGVGQNADDHVQAHSQTFCQPGPAAAAQLSRSAGTVSQTTQFPIDSGRLTEPVSTPWVTYPGLYSANCEQGGGATWLQVSSLAGTSHTRPVVNDDTEGNLGGTGPAWGYHGYEYWLTLGNLLQDVTAEEAAWESSH